MATADQGFNRFRARHNISGQMMQMLIAGTVALIVLVAAVIALPRTGTKTVRAQSGLGSAESTGAGSDTTGSSSGNVPGAGSAGLASNSAATVGSGGRGSGGGGSVTAEGAPGSAHVTSRFVPARGPGITNKSIYIGIGYSSQSAAGDRALGAAAAAPSYDTRNVYNAVIDYANRHGGYAGRLLVPLYYDINLTQDINTQLQAACAYWTQDHKVFVMGGGYDVIDACAEKAHTVAIGPGATAETFKKYPHLITATGIRFDRLGQMTVRALHTAGYFSGKLGLVTWDDPNYRKALKAGYIDTLATYHITPSALAYVPVPQQINALGDMTAAISSAVAKFKALGIDHVMIQDGNAGIFAGDGITFEFEQQAKSQNYYPRYGGNSNNAPGFAINPHDEEDHMLAIESRDGDPKYDEGWHTNKTREKCFKIQADAGYPVSPSNTNDEGIAAGACDAVFFIQRVVNMMPFLSNDEYIRISETLGKSFPSAGTYGTNLFPGRHDGGDMVRLEEYFNSCQCLKFKSPPAYVD